MKLGRLGGAIGDVPVRALGPEQFEDKIEPPIRVTDNQGRIQCPSGWVAKTSMISKGNGT